MTDDRIKAVFEEYGRIVTGKEYALIHAIAEAVSPQRTWVSLTDEEIEARAINFYNPEMYKRAVLWAQEKLKEKNQ